MFWWWWKSWIDAYTDLQSANSPEWEQVAKQYEDGAWVHCWRSVARESLS